jgi:RNA polymerase sigma factor (sigma-70 family)
MSLPRVGGVGRLSDQHQDYQALIAPIEDQMIRAVWGITQDAEEAEEAFQEALGQIWRKLDRIRRHENPHALILRICLNSAYDVLRKKARRRRRELLTEIRAVSKAPSPSEALASCERESAILRAIGRLSRSQATAVFMRLVQDRSYDEIAQVLGCKDSTVRKHVERGRERLRELLAPLAPHFQEETVQ